MFLSGVADMTTADLWVLIGTAPYFLTHIGVADILLEDMFLRLAVCLTALPVVGIAAVKRA